MSRSKHPDTCRCPLTGPCAKRFWIWWKRKYDDQHDIAIHVQYIVKLHATYPEVLSDVPF